MLSSRWSSAISDFRSAGCQSERPMNRWRRRGSASGAGLGAIRGKAGARPVQGRCKAGARPVQGRSPPGLNRAWTGPEARLAGRYSYQTVAYCSRASAQTTGQPAERLAPPARIWGDLNSSWPQSRFGLSATVQVRHRTAGAQRHIGRVLGRCAGQIMHCNATSYTVDVLVFINLPTHQRVLCGHHNGQF